MNNSVHFRISEEKMRGITQARNYAGMSKGKEYPSTGYQDIQNHMRAIFNQHQDRDYRYFMTVTFNKYANQNRLDEDLEHIIRIMNGQIFKGGHRKKPGCKLSMFVVREQHASGDSHYHLLIENNPLITLEKLAHALIYASERSKSLNKINIQHIHKLVARRNQSDINSQSITNILNSKDVALNLVEIPTQEDKEKLIRYVTKTLPKHGYANYYIFKDTSAGYYNFSTSSS